MSALSLPAFLCLFAALLLALHPRGHRLSTFLVFPGILLGTASGVVQWPALIAITGAAGLLVLLRHAPARWRPLVMSTIALWALAAAMHLIPGFTPLLWQNDFGREAAIPLRWYFDKGLGGLLLLYALRPAWIITDHQRWCLMIPICALLLMLAALSGMAELDPRWLSGSLIWLTGNLFLTVIAEEAFFRGLIQKNLQQMFAGRHAFALAAGLGALIFAAVHLPWGLPFALGAALAGLFYGWMAGPEGSLQRAIAAHFTLNALLLLMMHSPLG